ALDVFRVRQLTRRAGHPAKELERRWHRRGRGQVIHELRGNARVLKIQLDLCGVLGVDGLLSDTVRAEHRHDGERATKRAIHPTSCGVSRERLRSTHRTVESLGRIIAPGRAPRSKVLPDLLDATDATD